MSFANPILFALGFAFVALPIVLHFLRRRRPPVMWGAMRFLVEAYRRRRRRMTLEQLLLLLCRCALVVALALLIGRPIFGGGADAGAREVFIVLDNSIAASRVSGEGTALDGLKERAAAVLDGLDPAAGDRAALITLAGPAEGVVFPPSGDIGAVRRRLMQAEARDSAADLAGAISIVGSQDADAESAGRSVVLFSELLAGSAATSSPLPPLPASVESLVVAEPLESASSNVAVASVRSLRSVVVGAGVVGGQASVGLVRSGDTELAPKEVGVEIWAGGGGRLGSGSIGFEAGQASATGLIWFEAPEADARGPLVLEARLGRGIESDAVASDNVVRSPIDRRRVIEVGVIARRSLVGQAALDRFDAADWVRLALAPETDAGEIRVVDVAPSGVDGPRLSTLDAAVLLEPDSIGSAAWSDLRAFVDRGGLLLVTPSSGDDVQLWSDGFLESMSLGWSLDRAASETDDAVASALPADAADRAALLGMLAGEFEQLAAGVGVSRLVRVVPAGGEIEIATESGEPFVVTGAPMGDDGTPGAQGLVVYLASAPSPAWTDLPATPLMVPMLQELVRQGVGRAGGSLTAIAGSPAPAGAELLPIAADRGETGGPAAGPITGPITGPVRDAGVFRVESGRGAADRVLAINPDVSGSRLDVTDRVRLQAWLSTATDGEDRLAWLDAEGGVTSAGGADRAGDTGRLALALATLAAALAVIETLLARVASRGMSADLAGSAAA